VNEIGGKARVVSYNVSIPIHYEDYIMDIKTINERIEELAASEKITKAILTELSRVILAYVYETGDVTPTNRLINVLTPMNKRTAILYFKEFLSFRFDDVQETFGKKNKKTFDKKNELVTIFLLDEANNIFTWAEDNVKIEAKPTDWGKKLSSDFKNALADGYGIDDIMLLLQVACEDAGENVVVAVEDVVELDEAA